MKKKNKKTENNATRDTSDGSSVWTSMSDLFTSLSIIFLVMFVFALLKFALSAFETANVKKKHQEMLAGQIPEKTKQAAEQRKNQIDASIQEIQKYENEVNVRQQQLSAMVGRLGNHQKLLNELLEDQKKKDALFEIMANTVTTTKQVNETQSKKNQKLLQKVEMQNKMISKEQKANTSLQNKITALQKSADNEVLSYQQKIQDLKVEQSAKLADATSANSQAINLLKIDHESLIKKLEGKHQSALSQNNKENEKSLANVMAQNSKDLQEQHSKWTALQNQLDTQIQKNQSLGQELENSGSNHQQKMSLLGSAHEDSIKELKLSHAAALEQSKSDSQNSCAAIVAEKKQEIDQEQTARATLRNQLQTQAVAIVNLKNVAKKGKQQLIVAQKQITSNQTLRRKLGARIAKRFEGKDLAVETNPESGSISISLDDMFLFHNDSSELRETVKGRLQTIIPLYAQELLGEPDIRSRITSINVIGHASPRFGKAAVDPLTTDATAYNHNLVLSTNRAREIVKYVFSYEFGDFKYKYILRKKVIASGRSFSAPIALNSVDNISDKEFGRCEKFDCKKSRRVEISFSLDENVPKNKPLFAH
jgi:hypothetical protein